LKNGLKFQIYTLHLVWICSRCRRLIINYNTLLKYQQGEKYSYFDDDLGKGFSVEDLLNYINIEESLKEKQEWKIKGHITNVQIKNLRLFEDISFNLSPNINIVLGHNGLGKTSILQGITIALLPIENIDKSDDFTRKIRFNNKRAEVAIDYAENEQRVIHILPSGLFDINQVGTPPHILLSYGVNLNADTKISPEFIEILIKGNSKLYATKSIFKPYSNDFNDPLLVLYELERESKLNPECRKLIDLIVDKINDYLKLAPEGEKMKLVEEKGFYYFKDFNQNNLQLHHLSEGYKDHILLITDIFLRIIASRRSWASGNTEFVSSTIFEEAKGVILIDEFDRHLHPVWQRRLLFELKNDFPNIQFILTTHNVFSLQSAVGANAIQLVVKEGKIKVETKTIERKNILGIIDEFYTEEFFDYEAQQELSLFSKYLDRIHEGDVDFVYSDEFKGLIKKMYDMGDEIRTSIASQLLHLNSTLKKLNKKEFEL
jgi:predicted ATP-binding protein involved in virulence